MTDSWLALEAARHCVAYLDCDECRARPLHDCGFRESIEAAMRAALEKAAEVVESQAIAHRTQWPYADAVRALAADAIRALAKEGT